MLRGILAKFSLGYPDQALARSEAAVAEARRLAHLPSLALILAVGAVPFSLLGESAVLGKWADELVAVASEHGFAFFDAIGTSYRGWVKVKNGDVSEAIPLLQSGTAAFRGTGAELFPPYPVALLASACRIAGRIEESLTLLDEALRMVERIGDCWFAAELNRQKGQLLLRQGNSDAGEQLYRKALRIAQQDSAVESRAPSALMLRGRCRCAQLGIDTVTVRPTKEILLKVKVCASRERQRQADDDNSAKQNRAAKARMPARHRSRSPSINMTDKPMLRRLSGRLLLLLLLAALMRPAAGETIQLERNQHGTYTISVQINGALVLPFVLDTGASLVVIPEGVFRTLTGTGTVTKNDFIGTGTAMLADGSEHASDSYVLHEVRVGDHIVRNVVASVVSVNGAALLGQSFLSKLPAWSIDNTRQALVIADGAGATQSTPAAPTTTPVSPALSQYGAIAWDEGTGKRGWSLNQDTPQRAAEVALGACGAAGCKVIVSTGPGTCSALAATENGKYIGAASRADRIDARLAALANCQKGNAGECAIQLTTCNR